MKPKTKANLAMGVFLCACLVPSVGMLVLPEEPAAANQNLAPAPALTAQDGGLNPELLGEVTDYVEDHFALRQRMITANAALEGAVFRTSSQESVLMGREGWLFYRQTLDGYLHTDPMSARELFGAARTLALLTEYAGERDARLVFTVAPNKASLYPQYLPYVGTPLAGQDDIDRLLPLLEEEGVEYVDLFSPFREREEVLYHATDSHWTNRGAALAHDTLAEALGLEERWFTQPGSETGTHRGDLYEMVYPSGGRTEPETVFDRDFTFTYTRPMRSPEDQRIETESSGRPGNLLMFRDSFGNTLHPFLAQSCGKALFSRSMPFQMSLLDETGADTVVIELVERNLDYLSTRAPIFPAPVRQLTEQSGPGEGETALTAVEDGRLDGYVRLEGWVSGPVDENSPIYVQLGQTLYEASPVGEEGENPFTLYVPQGELAGEARVFWRQNGGLCTGETGIARENIGKN